MLPADAASKDERIDGAAASADDMSVGQLAHELNSLLDGSLRTLGLALEELEPVSGRREASPDSVVAKLAGARDALWQMAELLERAMHAGGGPAQVLHRSRPICREVDRILALVRPLADAHGVAVRAEVSPEAGPMPIGPLGAVLLNGLRNAIQACIRGGSGAGQVELEVIVGDGPTLVMRILDTGPGWPPAGSFGVQAGDSPGPASHGLGLSLSRRIVDELGGRLEVGTRPGGAGVLFRAEVPARSVSSR